MRPIYNWDTEYFIPLLTAELLFAIQVDSVMSLYVAIQRNITVNELKNSWKYKYTFEVRKLPNFDRKQILQ